MGCALRGGSIRPTLALIMDRPVPGRPAEAPVPGRITTWPVAGRLPAVAEARPVSMACMIEPPAEGGGRPVLPDRVAVLCCERIRPGLTFENFGVVTRWLCNMETIHRHSEPMQHGSHRLMRVFTGSQFCCVHSSRATYLSLLESEVNGLRLSEPPVD